MVLKTEIWWVRLNSFHNTFLTILQKKFNLDPPKLRLSGGFRARIYSLIFGAFLAFFGPWRSTFVVVSTIFGRAAGITRISPKSFDLGGQGWTFAAILSRKFNRAKFSGLFGRAWRSGHLIEALGSHLANCSRIGTGLRIARRKVQKHCMVELSWQ